MIATIILTLWLCIEIHGHSDSNPVVNETLYALRPMWKGLHGSFVKTIGREKMVLRVLTAASGVYTNKTKTSLLLGLSKTILLNVISYNGLASASRYETYIHNWLCYCNHFGLEPIVVVVGNKTLDFPNVDDLKKLAPQAHFISYPHYLFWELLSEKTSMVDGRRRY